MSFWTPHRISQALSPQLLGARPNERHPLGRISTDTRALASGDVFLALRGERFDGHDFLSMARSSGAAAVIVASPPSGGFGLPTFLVRDTSAALLALATYRRRAWGGPVVAVAGSNGKTSTKALIAAAVGSVLRVHATEGNLNNQVGVPQTLLALPDEAEIAVIEIGTSFPGEVALLRATTEPDIAVVTSIGEEHLEGLGSLAGVLHEECSVFAGTRIGVVPAAQPDVGREAATLAHQVVAAGIETGEVRPTAWGLDGEGRGWFTLGDLRVTVPLLGAHNVRNALLAIAVARACGVADADAARGIAGLGPLAMRGAPENIGTLLVLNDAYNANPASVREALTTLDALVTTRPRVAVLGSMLELGEQGPALHDAIARRALESKAQTLVGIGLFAEAFRRVAPSDPRILTSSDAEEAWPALRDRLAPDACILLKGSRGTRLERLVPKLRSFVGLSESPAVPRP